MIPSSIIHRFFYKLTNFLRLFFLIMFWCTGLIIWKIRDVFLLFVVTIEKKILDYNCLQRKAGFSKKLGCFSKKNINLKNDKAFSNITFWDYRQLIFSIQLNPIILYLLKQIFNDPETLDNIKNVQLRLWMT